MSKNKVKAGMKKDVDKVVKAFFKDESIKDKSYANLVETIGRNKELVKKHSKEKIAEYIDSPEFSMMFIELSEKELVVIGSELDDEEIPTVLKQTKKVEVKDDKKQEEKEPEKKENGIIVEPIEIIEPTIMVTKSLKENKKLNSKEKENAITVECSDYNEDLTAIFADAEAFWGSKAELENTVVKEIKNTTINMQPKQPIKFVEPVKKVEQKGYFIKTDEAVSAIAGLFFR